MILPLPRKLTNCYITCLLLSLSLGVSGQTPLIEATKIQNKNVVTELLEQGADVSEPQGDGGTALHWSVYRNDIDLTELLLRHGAEVNATDDHGVTALSLASLNNNPQLLRVLLKQGADVNLARINGDSPLMIAASVGNTEVLGLLVEAGANVNAREGSKGHTALMFAVAENHIEAVRFLVAKGAATFARSINDYTPLLFAAQQGNIEIGKYLLDNGADVNESAPDGISGNTNARWNLIPDTEASALLVAIDSGNEEMALMLLHEGADPNLDGAGRTALHSAVQHQMPTLVKALLDNGADPNARLTRNMPVLSRVILIDNGMSVYKLGATAFFLAASFGDLEIMNILVAGGADPQLTSNDGTTALMVAAGVDFVEGQDKYNRRWFDDNIVELQESAMVAVARCLELGLDINARNNKNQTALHGAVYLAGNQFISYIIENGAEINAINDRGQTAYMIADKGEYRAGATMSLPAVARHLEQLGANTTLGEDLGRYYERDAKEALEASRN